MEVDNGPASTQTSTDAQGKSIQMSIRAPWQHDISLSRSEAEKKIEENSGVKFPGQCMEAFVGSALTIDDHDFS